MTLDTHLLTATHVGGWPEASRADELSYTAWDLEPFAKDCGYEGPPFRWDPERRFRLRCELDACFFRLYGLTRQEVDYVLGTFPIVEKNEVKTWGEYRTRRVVGEVFEGMGATKGGQ